MKATTNMSPATVAKIQALIDGKTELTTIRNSLIQAVKIAAETPDSTELALVQSQSGYNAGGWRKPLMQIVGKALGVVPVLVWQETNPANPKQVGQQAAFFGPAHRAEIASAIYSAIWSWGNVQGNRELRLARASGKASGKSGKAGDRLQENVYNDLCAKILETLGKVKAVPVAEAVLAEFGKLGAKAAKGGIVFSGAYDQKLYDGALLLIK